MSSIWFSLLKIAIADPFIIKNVGVFFENTKLYKKGRKLQYNETESIF